MNHLLLSPDTLELEKHFSNGRMTVELNGGLDAAGAEQLEQLCAGIGRDGHGLVLDLSGLTFVDSAGLRSVLRLYGRCLKHRRELQIVPAPPAVQRVFSLTRAADVLPFVDGADTLVEA